MTLADSSKLLINIHVRIVFLVIKMVDLCLFAAWLLIKFFLIHRGADPVACSLMSCHFTFVRKYLRLLKRVGCFYYLLKVPKSCCS